MNQILQPHESHIPFPLQFMIDHNLFGMNNIHISDVKFRVSGPFGKTTLEKKNTAIIKCKIFVLQPAMAM